MLVDRVVVLVLDGLLCQSHRRIVATAVSLAFWLDDHLRELTVGREELHLHLSHLAASLDGLGVIAHAREDNLGPGLDRD